MRTVAFKVYLCRASTSLVEAPAFHPSELPPPSRTGPPGPPTWLPPG